MNTGRWTQICENKQLRFAVSTATEREIKIYLSPVFFLGTSVITLGYNTVLSLHTRF